MISLFGPWEQKQSLRRGVRRVLLLVVVVEVRLIDVMDDFNGEHAAIDSEREVVDDDEKGTRLVLKRLGTRRERVRANIYWMSKAETKLALTADPASVERPGTGNRPCAFP